MKTSSRQGIAFVETATGRSTWCDTCITHTQHTYNFTHTRTRTQIADLACSRTFPRRIAC